jgi:Family of unknown function (DUF6152)
MKVKLALALVSIWLLNAAAPAVAHHSASAEFDATKKITVTGALTKLDWVNPHTIFYMDVKAADGKVANWGWELPSPNQLMRAGWTRNSMKVGETITVEGIHARDGSNHGMAATVTLVSTGKQLFAGKAEEP